MNEQKESLKNELIGFLNENSAEELWELFKQNKTVFAYYRCALMEVETKLRVLDTQFSTMYDRNPIDMIKTRMKSLPSIRNKLERKGLPVSMEAIQKNIFDIAGIRVICPFVDDIYMLAECLEQQDDVRIIQKKDYIQNPKDNGYRSLHLLVEIPIFLQNEKRNMIVEVQLRTIAMEFWANIEHDLRYKKNLSPEMLQQVSDELIQCADISTELDHRMQKIRDTVNRIS